MGNLQGVNKSCIVEQCSQLWHSAIALEKLTQQIAGVVGQLVSAPRTDQTALLQLLHWSDSLQVEGVEQYPYRAVGTALEVIPRTLAQNCGANVIRTLTKLRAKHADSTDCTFGLNGNTGEIVDMKELGVWEPYAVKVSSYTLVSTNKQSAYSKPS